MEVLFGEAREFTAQIVLLFDWGGEKSDRRQPCLSANSRCSFSYRPVSCSVVRDPDINCSLFHDRHPTLIAPEKVREIKRDCRLKAATQHRIFLFAFWRNLLPP
jgi:hypothetical protein